MAISARSLYRSKAKSLERHLYRLHVLSNYNKDFALVEAEYILGVCKGLKKKDRLVQGVDVVDIVNAIKDEINDSDSADSPAE